MASRNLDSIQKTKTLLAKGQPKVFSAARKIDAISQARRQKVVNSPAAHQFFYVTPATVSQSLPSSRTFAFWPKLVSFGKMPVTALALALLLAFSGGMWVALTTTKTAADDQPPISQGGSIALDSSPVPANIPISNDLLFNTPIEQLKNYFQSVSEPDVIEKRAGQLAEFLEQRKSPLAPEAETIAEQPHWKLILAIAFAESTLGKHCYEFNCSGIGGSQIKTYASSKQWIVDFNRLLEQHYKDQTLEQMCGVYVQPCNPNWLLATKQILSGLQEQGIE